ncbi:Thioredoxin-like fold,Glutathione S-transferase, C-terminal,Glutathione S-transferase, C-terminal- [Cinara cedri]|uniref:glutathione transferase n=1 Tax=Cinara cedri TaxID=506608 RepID=A0A5E4N1C2_9HEMI|nr:Thioredoxin-like fold,Glutathione S-transferase, C-terminal,Glutathione S-transferase, C-terminal- [Cinara cedri]
MIVDLKYSILFVVYGIMILNRTTTSETIDPELSASLYFNGMSADEIEKIIFSKPLTLIYFNSHGLAEPLRLIMYYAEIKFTDNRISEEDWYNKYKKLMPFGQLPVLKIDVEDNKSIYLHQSLALCRYIAKFANLVGDKSPWTMLLIDKVVGNIEDFLQEFKKVYYEKDETIKEKLNYDLIHTKIPLFMTEYEEIAEKNDAHFVQEKLTWADIYGVAIFDFMGKLLNIDMYENKPVLRRLREKVYNIKKISEALIQRSKIMISVPEILFPSVDQICAA